MCNYTGSIFGLIKIFTLKITVKFHFRTCTIFHWNEKFFAINTYICGVYLNRKLFWKCRPISTYSTTLLVVCLIDGRLEDCLALFRIGTPDSHSPHRNIRRRILQGNIFNKNPPYQFPTLFIYPANVCFVCVWKVFPT